MSLGTYGGIKADILAQLDRVGDTSITDRWQAFTELAEARIWQGGEKPLETEPLRATDMETSADLSVVAGSVLLPNDHLETRRIYWDRDIKRALHYRTPNEFWINNLSANDQPVIFTQEGSALKFAPAMTGTAKILYYAKPAALENDEDTNWLMTEAPGVYREAIMMEVQRHLKQDAGDAFALFKSAVEGLMNASFRRRTSGRPLYPKIRNSYVRHY